jgi:hypothetical protein
LRTGRLGFVSLESVAALTYAVSALRLACLAPLGLVLESLVGEKHLLAGGEDKLGTAFRALQNPILVLHRLLRDPTLVGGPKASSEKSDLIQMMPADRSEDALGKPKGPNCVLLRLILLASLLFAQALARQRLFGASLFTGFHVEAMLLDFLDNVLLLHLALETTQSVFKRLTFLNDDFSHAKTHLPSLLWAIGPEPALLDNTFERRPLVRLF